MRKRPTLNFAVATVCVLLLHVLLIVPPTAASPICEKSIDGPVDETTASAGTWTNLRNNPGSIRFESARMLNGALKQLPHAVSPPRACEAPCSPSAPHLVFESAPLLYLSDYTDKRKCDLLFTKTTAAPLRFPERVFARQDEFNDWFSAFSQGKGQDGGKLYEQCDGDCSPRYHTFIRVEGGKLVVRAEAVCGPARDKDDNQYRLKFFLRWNCKEG